MIMRFKIVNLYTYVYEFSGQVCTFDGTLIYSFDYAQQVHYPHHAQEVGPLFFKTPRKCQAFGVCAEGPGINIIENLTRLH
jgi:hypothetical protein